MTGGVDPPPPPPPPSNDGEFLLRLVQNPHPHPHPHNHHQHPQPPSGHNLSLDPAVAAVGPSIPIPNRHQHHDPRSSSSFSLSPQNPNFFFHNNPAWPHHHDPRQHFDLLRHHHQQQQQQRQEVLPPSTVLFGNIPFPNNNNSNNNNNTVNLSDHEKKMNLELGLLKQRHSVNGFDPDRRMETRVNWVHGSPPQRQPGPPPGFVGKNQRRGFISELSNNGGWEVSSSDQSNHNSGFGSSFGGRDYEKDRRFSSEQRNYNSGFGSSFGGKDYEKDRCFSSEQSNYNSGVGSSFGYGGKDYEKDRRFSSGRDNGGVGVSGQIEHPGLPGGSNLRSVSAVDFEDSMLNLHDNGVSQDEVDELSEQLVGSVLQDDETDDKNGSAAVKKHHRDKDFRSDARGKCILSQRMRNSRRLIECRRDIDRLNSPLLALYESLIPPEVEKAKKKQLLTLLEKLVCKEWPNARLYLYGSCANSFGVSKSDIDVCLAIDDQDVNKSEMLLKLADILQSDNLQNVQALTRARVPIVKLMDPVTGISCDICINNVLAVVNTKLLRDYAEIDVRLRQLAFLVKHWAKSRGVNETYQGTLSSYAYVLMCIHFLQQRNPPILPCLQGMKPTYAVTVDDIRCAYFDQVEKLRDFGSRNKEGIGHLLWGFFNYWAYCHDYANNVISIRTGSILSKHEKDWTRRIGNDRHLICIEDPFETGHDLGRVVDKHSIRVLREEFERAAEILQYDPNPCAVLFDPYIPPTS